MAANQKQLTLKDFKSDYQHLVVRHPDPHIRRPIVAKYIERVYSHIASECLAYTKEK